MEKHRHFDQSTIEMIAAGITSCKTATELSEQIGFDVSGLIKHIKSNLAIKETLVGNKCGLKAKCSRTLICEKCAYAGRKEPKLCKTCKQGCRQVCDSYTAIPDCPRLRKFPYCCNGCPKATPCHLNHLIYDPVAVWRKASDLRSSSRKGPHSGEGEMARLSAILVPLVKGKNQTIGQIFLTHREEIRWSYPTILSYIDKGLIPGLINLDLQKRCKYPKRYRKKASEPTNAAFLQGRTYDGFVAAVSESPMREVVEMDTVVSCRDGKGAVLTLLFRKSNFMLAYLLPEKTSDEVAKVFAGLQKLLGDALYSEAFGLILTDNGSEFADPTAIEFSKATGARLARLFYCDPGKSGQKGKIEKNHVELRKVFPKPFDFSKISQAQLNDAMSHVNSEPRACLNGNSPSEVARAFLNEKVLALNEHRSIEPDMVFLSPSLIK